MQATAAKSPKLTFGNPPHVYAPSPVSGQAIMSNTSRPKLQGDGAVYEHGQLVGYRREVTTTTVAFSMRVFAARGHRNGNGQEA